MRQSVQTSIGLVLLVLGLLGPFTFADDLRHSGEIAVAAGFALSGLFLLAPGLFDRMRGFGSSPVASPFVLVGLAAGALMDEAMLGVFLGTCTGLAAAWWHHSKHSDIVARRHIRSGPASLVGLIQMPDGPTPISLGEDR